mmetsp:Transcript_18025/g.24029  ORF Transcript_18025/g.24029 Transcript_18025/m.24029 type:complete len:221 (+) Transcript_18025:394-1056(+)
MYILCNLGGGDLTGSNSPDRLVGDDNAVHFLLGDTGEALLQLDGADGTSEVLLVFGEGFANAEHDAHSLLNKLETLAVDVFVGFSEEDTALGVTGEGPLHTDGVKHGAGDGSCESTLHLRAYSLSANHELVTDSSHSRFNENIGNKEGNISIRTFLRNRSSNISSKLDSFFPGLGVKLPVSRNERLPCRKLCGVAYSTESGGKRSSGTGKESSDGEFHGV